MKINKSKLSKALKQIGIFVGKNSPTEYVSLVHFTNKNNKAVVFATDMLSAGRVSFDTEEADEFDFCTEYTNLIQAVKIRNKEITVEKFFDRVGENGEKTTGIEFFDDKTKFVYPLRSSDELLEIETKTALNTNIKPIHVKAKILKEAITNAGYARNEKDAQSIFLTGINLSYEDNYISIVSTDRTRAACFKQEIETEESVPGKVQAILSPKTISSIMIFNDEDKLDIRIGESEITISSDDNNIETYSTKILSDYPDVLKLFNTDVINSYEVDVKDILESLSILSGDGIVDIKLEFDSDKLKLSSQTQSGSYLEDYVSCQNKTGNKESIWLSLLFFSDAIKHINEEKVTLETRGDSSKIFSYKAGSLSGIIAPKNR